jgi:predicted RNA-binding Zn ribbon-like protein
MSAPSEASPEVRLISDFVNTFDVEGGNDEISEPPALRAWLVERGLLPRGEAVTEADVRNAGALRESLREVLAAHHDGDVTPDELERINDAVARYPVVVTFDRGGEPRVAPAAGGVDGALASIVGGVVATMGGDDWLRLKACARDSCRWVFYDQSKNQSKRWCSMQVCGNRTKTKAYRDRKKAPESDT